MVGMGREVGFPGGGRTGAVTFGGLGKDAGVEGEGQGVPAGLFGRSGFARPLLGGGGGGANKNCEYYT